LLDRFLAEQKVLDKLQAVQVSLLRIQLQVVLRMELPCEFSQAL
jgi:hypothetical protein